MSGGKARGLDLEQQPQLEDLVDILDGDRRHDVAEALARDDQFFLAQPRQGTAQGRLGEIRSAPPAWSPGSRRPERGGRAESRS